MVAIITGGTRGIGKACVEVFKREGWDVISTSSKEDVRSLEMCKKVVKDTLDEYGRIDCLVNNAGIGGKNLLLTMSPKEWYDVIDVKLHGTFNMTKAVLFTMLKQKSGSIINISSTAAIMGSRGQSHYGAANAGVLGFTRCLARELTVYDKKIRVNAIAPGIIETSMTKEDLQLDESQEKIKCFVPMKDAGQPIDVAEMVYFLASDKARYITGDVIRVDGGLVTGDDG